MPTYQLNPTSVYANPTQEQIARILAKGGFLIPDAPAFNPATHHAPIWNPAPNTADPANWIVTAFTQQELDANADKADRSSKRLSVGQQVAALRSWATDANTAVAAWDGQNTAQRFATLKIVVNRFGTMSSHLADLLEGLRVDLPE